MFLYLGGADEFTAAISTVKGFPVGGYYLALGIAAVVGYFPVMGGFEGAGGGFGFYNFSRAVAGGAVMKFQIGLGAATGTGYTVNFSAGVPLYVFYFFVAVFYEVALLVVLIGIATGAGALGKAAYYLFKIGGVVGGSRLPFFYVAEAVLGTAVIGEVFRVAIAHIVHG